MISRKFNKVFRKSKKKRKEKMEIKKTLRMIMIQVIWVWWNILMKNLQEGWIIIIGVK